MRGLSVSFGVLRFAQEPLEQLPWALACAGIKCILVLKGDQSPELVDVPTRDDLVRDAFGDLEQDPGKIGDQCNMGERLFTPGCDLDIHALFDVFTDGHEHIESTFGVCSTSLLDQVGDTVLVKHVPISGNRFHGAENWPHEQNRLRLCKSRLRQVRERAQRQVDRWNPPLDQLGHESGPLVAHFVDTSGLAQEPTAEYLLSDDKGLDRKETPAYAPIPNKPGVDQLLQQVKRHAAWYALRIKESEFFLLCGLAPPI
jgi:hypothetical protein